MRTNNIQSLQIASYVLLHILILFHTPIFAQKVTTYAGVFYKTSFANGTCDKAHFNFPYGVAVDSLGNIICGRYKES